MNLHQLAARYHAWAAARANRRDDIDALIAHTWAANRQGARA